MTKGRMEAFSDGVIAILITIKVLELGVPHGTDLDALAPLAPVLLSYVLSFANLAIYWNNHHHLLQAAHRVDGRILWANLHLLFWLSLIPFTTSWMGEHELRPWPTAVYGLSLLACSMAWHLMQTAIIRSQGEQSDLRRAVGGDWKGKASAAGYLLGVGAAFVEPVAAALIYAAIASLWLVPDRRVHRLVATPDPTAPRP